MDGHGAQRRVIGMYSVVSAASLHFLSHQYLCPQPTTSTFSRLADRGSSCLAAACFLPPRSLTCNLSVRLSLHFSDAARNTPTTTTSDASLCQLRSVLGLPALEPTLQIQPGHPAAAAARLLKARQQLRSVRPRVAQAEVQQTQQTSHSASRAEQSEQLECRARG